MKLHQSVVEKIIRLYDLYGGRKDNSTLLAELNKIDLTAYTQKDNPQAQTFLVLTEAVQKAKTGVK